MDKTIQDIDDINFILGELKRFASMPFQELIEHLKKNPRDGLHSIPNPFNPGDLICGRNASHLFYQLATRFLATQKGIDNDFDEELFTDALIKEFVHRFLKHGKEVNKSNVQSLLSAALKKSKVKHESLIHYIPCRVVFENNPREFHIGPVHFRRMEDFSLDHEELFEVERRRLYEDHRKRCEEARENGDGAEQVVSPDPSAKYADFLVDETKAFFSDFKWIAEVTIPTCDKTVSRQRAESAVEAALDILKLFFRELHGKRLGQGHAPTVPSKHAKLARKPNGSFDFSLSLRPGDMPVGRRWFEAFSSPEVQPYLLGAASAVDARIDPAQSSQLKERFLDALAWYGQGVAEILPSIKVVKYVAAWERLTITKKENDLTDTVSRRIGLLAHDGCQESYETTREKAKKVYEWRSNLMHGTSSPFEKALRSIAPLAEEITQAALFQGLATFVSLSQEIAEAKSTDLEKRYRALETDLGIIDT